MSTAAAGQCQLAYPPCIGPLVAASRLTTSPDKKLQDKHLLSRHSQPRLARPSKQTPLRELPIRQSQAFLNKKPRCAWRCFAPTDACVSCALPEYTSGCPAWSVLQTDSAQQMCSEPSVCLQNASPCITAPQPARQFGELLHWASDVVALGGHRG